MITVVSFTIDIMEYHWLSASYWLDGPPKSPQIRMTPSVVPWMILAFGLKGILQNFSDAHIFLIKVHPLCPLFVKRKGNQFMIEHKNIIHKLNIFGKFSGSVY